MSQITFICFISIAILCILLMFRTNDLIDKILCLISALVFLLCPYINSIDADYMNLLIWNLLFIVLITSPKKNRL
ncbi:hypothetical protein AN640_07010 [Candidatus Epulonipiscium fishelsonii]|uniref:Uncharacterized protein n=1 Tax=Candidatus Epulonipiscium fishelsonii TaxID=77094 RepID=A0ACC8XH70_9FIRM|nr:hypothetical protein AN640_07010 [Epulopiscium sp. SCG-D08WGA-EpuloA1]OON97033.1 MAG: hypothetical protein ATN32_00750 [Epulopiscium sp. AS2M-Bin002]